MRTLAGEPPTPAGGSRLAAIDGLRGFAVALVVLYHLWPGITKPLALTIVPLTGWVGVDLFFFISGFAIFYPYARTAVDGRPEQTLSTFFLRRAGKIVPSYVLAIAAVLVFGIAAQTPGTSLAVQLVTHALFVHNWFSGTEDGLIGVLWSLAVEVQFYALFGLTRSLAVRSPLGYAGTLVAIALAFRLTIAFALHRHDGPLFDQLPANLDLFGAGIACAYLYRFVDARRPHVAARTGGWTVLAVAGTACAYALLFVIARSASDPGFSNSADAFVHLAETAACLGIGLGTLFAAPSWKRIVANSLTLFLADISYNLYIWHQLIYLEVRHLLGDQPGRAAAAAAALGSLAIALAFTTLLTKYFEHPLQRQFRRLECR